MKKNSLASKGLSLSQAQSISNLCNQRALEITAKLSGINNYSKTVSYAGKDLITVVGKPLPEDVVALLTEKASLHACQAFLMENINAKDSLLKELKRAGADVSSVEFPEKPKTISPLINMLPEVNEDWGWAQLSSGDICDYLEAEAFASHIGQFIHQPSAKGTGTLDTLRRELGAGIAPIEWFSIKEGEKTPITVITHHTSEKLLAVHEELAALHRGYEQRVNFFKARVKNLVTAENARIAKINADAQNDAEKLNNDANAVYETAVKACNERVRSIQAEFEKARQASIKEVAALRINVDGRFQKVVDTFLPKLSDTQE